MAVDEMINQFCSRIRKLKEIKEISLETLSQDSGVPLEMLEQLEQNILPEEMTVDDAYALSKVFQCKIGELFE